MARRVSERVGGTTVELSHTDKLFFPDDGISKGGLIGYYSGIAPAILPYLRDRPLVMGRYPDGITGQGIVQKNVPRHFPDWVRRAEVLARRSPEELTVEQRKDQRGRRLYLDVMRNAYAQTAVAPYAVRPRRGAPVAAPLGWEELQRGGLSPGEFTVGTIRDRLERSGDPWAGMARHRKVLSGPRRRLAELADRAG